MQSITILKDAAATAIYCSKAANGVVVVETKLPQAGSLRLTYNGNMQLSFADLSDYNLMNSYEKLTFERLAGCYRLIDDNGNIINTYQSIREAARQLGNIKKDSNIISGIQTHQKSYGYYWEYASV